MVKTSSGLTVGDTILDGSDASFQNIEKYVTVPADQQDSEVFTTGSCDQIRALENPKAREIIDAMKASTSGITFDSTLQLSQDIWFRIYAMLAFVKCNSGEFDMDYFNDDIQLLPRLGTTDASRLSSYWSFLPPNGASYAQFMQTPNTTPSEAVASVPGATMPFRGECAGAFQMAVYFGLLNGLGATTFDGMAATFGQMMIGPWRLGPKTPNPATLYMKTADLDEDPIPGDYLYFKNKDDYLKWAPDGFWTGLNAMYMGKDALGTRHYSGMGASWLSEDNLRASLVNAYYHDCSPHTIDDPETEVRFTQRATLTIPANLETTVPQQSRTATAPQTPDKALLNTMGFEAHAENTLAHTNTKLGDVAQAHNIEPHAVSQVQSAPLDNPPHKIISNGASTIIHYHDANADRFDPNAAVHAIVSFNAKG